MSKEIIDYGFGVIETRETFYTEETIKQKDKKIADLEAKLAESEKKAYSRGHSQRDIANEIKLNALREDVANKEKRIVELKQQLHDLPKKIVCEISEAIERLSWRKRIYTNWEFDKEQLYKDLDTILKKYGGENE